MDQMNTEVSGEVEATIETTIGELVEVITEIALKAGKTETEGYRLASMTIEKLTRERNKRPTDLLS
jgi:hypothetical protein